MSKPRIGEEWELWGQRFAIVGRDQEWLVTTNGKERILYLESDIAEKGKLLQLNPQPGEKWKYALRHPNAESGEVWTVTNDPVQNGGYLGPYRMATNPTVDGAGAMHLRYHPEQWELVEEAPNSATEAQNAEPGKMPEASKTPKQLAQEAVIEESKNPPEGISSDTWLSYLTSLLEASPHRRVPHDGQSIHSSAQLRRVFPTSLEEEERQRHSRAKRWWEK